MTPTARSHGGDGVGLEHVVDERKMSGKVPVELVTVGSAPAALAAAYASPSPRPRQMTATSMGDVILQAVATQIQSGLSAAATATWGATPFSRASGKSSRTGGGAGCGG